MLVDRPKVDRRGGEAGEGLPRFRGGGLEGNLRSGDDDLGIDELLVKGRALVVLVGRGHERVARILEPLADAKLVLGGSQKLRDLENAGLALYSPHTSMMESPLSIPNTDPPR